MFKERIYWKFITSFFLFAVCILSVSLYLLSRHAESFIQNSIDESTQFQQNRVDMVARYFMEAGTMPVQSVAGSIELHRYFMHHNNDDLLTVSHWMATSVSSSTSQYRAELYDPKGNVLVAYYTNRFNHVRQDTLSVGHSRFEPNSLHWAKGQREYYSPVTSSQDYSFPDHPNNHVMLVLSPVKKAGFGEVIGYVGLFLDMDMLLRVMTTNNALDLFVVDKQGFLIASSTGDNQHNSKSLRFTTAVGLPASISNKQLHDIGWASHSVAAINNNQGITLYSRAAQSFLDERNEEIHDYIIDISLVVLLFSAVFGSLLAISPSRMVSSLKRVSKERNQYLKIMDQYVPVIETDLLGVVTNCNTAFSILSEYPREDLIGQRASILSFGQNTHQSSDMWDTLSRRLSWQGEFHNVTRSGREFWLFSTVIPIYKNGKLTGYMSVSTDKTEKKRLELLAEMDSLTEIYNRAKLDKCLAQEQARSRRYGTFFSVIMLDVDFFKRVNDTYGHLTGDKVLHQLAIMLNNSTRVVDEVGRWGGEEFMIVCPETTLQDAEILAEKVRASVESFTFPEVGRITVSLGVAMYEAPLELERTIAEADFYLYEAKKLGRNRVASRLSKITSLKTVGNVIQK
ncbi:diguanylate cyclase [Vibrio tritonius]|uniref:diguanylate cyclase n=1 Tax=Vibrio tritonius TaxID=1435069 RepID=A0ABS7YUD7_9VIBR|nr:sensor domain-containing diguanylate cyclase [Vibrio tritonius]MCA2018501.1 diguanylate cyclase [Vibrio tritonius]